MAHELNSQPLPILPETFDLLRLPPPHQRLGEVNFNIVPDAELTFESEEDEDLTSESDEDEARTEDGADAFKGEEGEAEGEPEDEDMEEVDVDEPVVRQERQVDEDYDD